MGNQTVRGPPAPLMALGIVASLALWFFIIYVHHSEDWSTPDLTGLFPVVVVPLIVVLVVVAEGQYILRYMRRSCGLPVSNPGEHNE
jgi:hypothetical protein